LGFRIEPTLPDSNSAELDGSRIFGTLLDVPLTERLLWETYRYGKLLEPHDEDLESTSAGIANNLGLPFAQLANAYDARGNTEQAVRNLERAALLSPSPAIKAALSQLLLEQTGPKK
jgi:hypothetical protein